MAMAMQCPRSDVCELSLPLVQKVLKLLPRGKKCGVIEIARWAEEDIVPTDSLLNERKKRVIDDTLENDFDRH